jgi:RNA polymerase primary sigma factor
MQNYSTSKMIQTKAPRCSSKRSRIVAIGTIILMTSSSIEAFSAIRQSMNMISSDYNPQKRKLKPINMVVANVLEEPPTRVAPTKYLPNDPWQNLENNVFIIEQTESPISVDVRKYHDGIYKHGHNSIPKQKKTIEYLTVDVNNTSIKTSRRKVLSASSYRIKDRPPRESKSSTMPGFRNKETLKMRSDKLSQELFEKTTGKKLRKTSKTDHKKKMTKNTRDMYAASATVPDSLIDFTNRIHKEERITPTDEISLGTKTRESIRLLELYGDLETKYGREPTDDEWCAAAGKINMESLRQTIQEGNAAKDKLVTSNLRMVQRVVNLYIRNGLGSQYNAGDLMQEGTMALMRAAEKYEPERGFRFSTYAMYWIRASVKRSQILQSRVINVPQRFHETFKKIQKIEKEMADDLGRNPTISELANACNLTEAQLERCVKAMKQQTYSLDQVITNPFKPNSDSRESTLYDKISYKCDEYEYTPLEDRFMKDDLVKTLRRYLTPREVDILLLRYGLMDEKTLPHGFSGPLTYSEVSRLVGCKPDKVRRIINDSLKRLKPLIANEWENALA